MHVSRLIGESSLDEVVSPAEQEEWLENGKPLSNGGIDLYQTVEEKYKIRNRKKFDILKKDGEYPIIKRILNIYIHNCLPAYKKTEKDFWSLSCLPTTGGSSFRRYFCMNVNFMEVFVAGFDRELNEPFAFFVLSTLFMRTPKDINRILTRFPEIDFVERNYKAAGVDQVSIFFSNLKQVEDILLTEPIIVKSIRELNLRLMRKGSTIFSNYNCFDLVNDVLS